MEGGTACQRSEGHPRPLLRVRCCRSPSGSHGPCSVEVSATGLGRQLLPATSELQQQVRVWGTPSAGDTRMMVREFIAIVFQSSCEISWAYRHVMEMPGGAQGCKGNLVSSPSMVKMQTGTKSSIYMGTCSQPTLAGLHLRSLTFLLRTAHRAHD